MTSQPQAQPQPQPQPNPVQTTDAGIPVQSDKYSLTVGANGPILLQDSYLIEQMANFKIGRAHV